MSLPSPHPSDFDFDIPEDEPLSEEEILRLLNLQPPVEDELPDVPLRVRAVSSPIPHAWIDDLDLAIAPPPKEGLSAYPEHEVEDDAQ